MNKVEIEGLGLEQKLVAGFGMVVIVTDSLGSNKPSCKG
jgi:hypothetical protein